MLFFFFFAIVRIGKEAITLTTSLLVFLYFAFSTGLKENEWNKSFFHDCGEMILKWNLISFNLIKLVEILEMTVLYQLPPLPRHRFYKFPKTWWGWNFTPPDAILKLKYISYLLIGQKKKKQEKLKGKSYFANFFIFIFFIKRFKILSKKIFATLFIWIFFILFYVQSEKKKKKRF